MIINGSVLANISNYLGKYVNKQNAFNLICSDKKKIKRQAVCVVLAHEFCIM